MVDPGTHEDPEVQDGSEGVGVAQGIQKADAKEWDDVLQVIQVCPVGTEDC